MVFKIHNISNFMAHEGIVIDPKLEVKIRDSLNHNGNDHSIRCYDASRKMSKQAFQFGYPKITVRDGLAIYSLDFLRDLISNQEDKKELQRTMHQKKSRFSHLTLDHSWGEMLEPRIRIDFIPYIKLPEGVFDFDVLLMTKMDAQIEGVEYFPIGREFSLFGSNYVYNPLCGPKIGPLQLPKIVRLM